LRYIPELDGLRAFAILGVLLVHSNFALHTPALEMYRSWGWIGVDLFFVISGYLITSILLASKEKPGYYVNFYARRGLRIWPLYYLLLFFVFVASPHLGDWANQRLDLHIYHWRYYVLYVQNLVLPHLGSFALVITWSLCVEEQFYLVWPFLVRTFSRRTLERLVVATLALEPLIRLELQRYNSPFFAYYTPARLDSIAAGALVALRPRWLKHAWIAAPFAYVLLWRHEYVWSYSALALAFGWLVGYIVVNGSRILRWTPLCFIGKISYGVYIYHTIFFVLYWSTPLFRLADSLPLHHVWHLLFQIALPIPVATASWYLLEQPILKLKRFFETRRDTYQPLRPIEAAPELVLAEVGD
jgi:peptidoglycan/LPS O-acetylase OafA/YrhL